MARVGSTPEPNPSTAPCPRQPRRRAKFERPDGWEVLAKRAVRRSLLSVLVPAAWALAAAVGCDRPPAADNLPAWTPQDHGVDRESKDQGPKVAAQAAPKETAGSVAWRARCASCHGAGGRGDGPEGASLKPTDLTDAAWQASRDDAAIRSAILEGKNGRMPKFALPDDVVGALVAHIRTFGAGSPPSP